MKILLLGKDGQVGWELQRSLAPLGEVVACGRREVDLEDMAGLRDFVERQAPQVIVNAAAYTAVDKAESEQVRVQRINGDAVGILAEVAELTNAWLIHYSTDYVFDGTSHEPYTEDDTPNPRNAYGRSKVAGEVAIRVARCKHLIFRTSWVFAARGSNFAKTILSLACERNELSVIADQFGAPTGADLIADISALALYRIKTSDEKLDALSGTYHLAAGGETSWHGYAQHVIDEALRRGAALKINPKAIHAVSAKDYPLPALRPANSRLNTAKLSRTFQIRLPHWQMQVTRMVDELIGNSDL